LIDAKPLRKGSQALLTILYRSTDRLCRFGAPMKNLSNSASLQTDESIAPSNAGIKHQMDLRLFPRMLRYHIKNQSIGIFISSNSAHLDHQEYSNWQTLLIETNQD